MTTAAPTTTLVTSTTPPGRLWLRAVAPNWFAAVMGTGIVANAAATLPWHPPLLLDAARVVWLLDAALLVLVVAATVLQWRHERGTARGHLDDPVLAPFYGAPAMALLTVGAGALLVGVPVVGLRTAVVLDAVLWSAGTALGLATAVLVPLRQFTRGPSAPDAAVGGWLMPVVPPMVSAATAPLLVPHLPVGAWRQALQLLGTMMFGAALLASLVVITMVWSRLALHDVGPTAAVPTLWIVLGPLGQSVTAAHTLGATAPSVLPAPYGTAFEALGLVYGVPVWGFAVLWLAIALGLTVRTARSSVSGLPFSLTWWSFTFPVGTVVTGTSALGAATGAPFLAVVACVLYAGLVGAWGVVAVRTVRGLRRGTLLSPVR
ncbi:TDT family transporter [Lapillicoccus jejuensis]|uniref:C4-dicarboxylate transporter/malic acid transport protein n=1 Tax=Lapillicoccus jejuensis TaxID=402171 RepID=A0A542DXM1_9MICO|nr:TDT family transporter [Lapillicoccus jejuensis]TQJ07827.1 C4-dicarboxylate transporter/malic acid transport protein [Lapillicoccus jejuensis]